MKKLEYLYHGSPKKLIGETLNPSQGEDLDERPDNQIFAVFASDLKEFAIAMAIISCNDLSGGSIVKYTKPLGVIYGGNLPKQKYVYLHTLPKEKFKKSPNIKHQFVSSKPIKPIKTEKIEINKYLDVIRLASKEETKKWKKKYPIYTVTNK